MHENRFNEYRIPSGMLIVFLEKALTLIHMETHLDDVSKSIQYLASKYTNCNYLTAMSKQTTAPFYCKHFFEFHSYQLKTLSIVFLLFEFVQLSLIQPPIKKGSN
jgi:hypothetical protein